MNRLPRAVLFACFAAPALYFLASCAGRLDDGKAGRIDFGQLDLQPGKPALVGFAALWCKPCREEIPQLNRAAGDFANRLQLRTYLVEGALEGVASTPADPTAFVSKDGVAPTYAVGIDPRWAIFATLNPQKRALPTIAFVGGDGIVRGIVQRSLDYETELRPMIDTLLAGTIVVQPTPTPAEDSRVVAFADWKAEDPSHQTGGTVYENFKASWQTGVDKFAFDPAEMPFESGEVSERRDSPSEPYGLSSALWLTETCRLTVYVRADGTYLRSTGVCW